MAGWRVVAGAAVCCVVLAAAAAVAMAVPLDTHHDVKKSYPPEQAGVDEEVRQLLDLKSLSQAHRNQQQQKQEGGENGPASADLAPSTPAAAASAQAGDEKDSQGDARQVTTPKKTRKDAFTLANGPKEQHRVTSEGEMVHHTPSSQGDMDVKRHQEQGHLPLLPPLHSRHHQQQMEMEVPSEGIQEAMMDEDEGRTLFSLDHKAPFRYSPLELALYIYNTGDDESVALAILELVTEGLMTTENALAYQHEIRENLEHLRNQASQGKEIPSEYKSLVEKNELGPLSMSEMYPGGVPSDLMLGGGAAGGGPDADYEGMLERMRSGSVGVGGGVSQDYAYTQYSLEEVIYQLAKILFKQAMHREGDLGSERALQEVATLLEKEVARGAITPEVEKKVLDVMVNSLVDSLGENEFPSAPGPVMGGSNFRLPNEASSFPMGAGPSSMIGGSNFKPSSDLFQLSKSTTKREAPEQKKTDKKV